MARDQLLKYRNSNQQIPVYALSGDAQDQALLKIRQYLQSLEIPEFATRAARQRFLKKASKHFVQEGHLFRRCSNRIPVKVIFDLAERQKIMQEAHDKHGHKGVQATFETIRQRFFWPYFHSDTQKYVSSCHECQIRSTKKVEIPVTISTPVTIFTKIYLDTMLMPVAKGYRYIVAARDDLSGACEARALKEATARAVSQFLWEQIICRYGTIAEIVTDNGTPFIKDLDILASRYHIYHI